MPYRPRIKICCMKSVAEAQMAVAYGVTALGLVSEMPSGPGIIDEGLIREIAEAVPPGIGIFLLTSLVDAGEIIEQHHRCKTNTIQLTDRLERGSYDDIRVALPGIKIVQVVHVQGAEAIEEAQRVAKGVDGLLLDSGNQQLPIKELGGTGRRHDWRISRQIRAKIDKPLLLAGGLRPENVSEAVRQVVPYGLDVCSGVRTGDRLDEEKLRRFVERALSTTVFSVGV